MEVFISLAGSVVMDTVTLHENTETNISLLFFLIGFLVVYSSTESFNIFLYLANFIVLITSITLGILVFSIDTSFPLGTLISHLIW